MSDNQLEQVDFLKLDCEGSEYSILYNASAEVLGKIRRMAIETHLSNTERHNTAELSDYLKSKGFSTNMDKDIIWAWS